MNQQPETSKTIRTREDLLLIVATLRERLRGNPTLEGAARSVEVDDNIPGRVNVARNGAVGLEYPDDEYPTLDRARELQSWADAAAVGQVDERGGQDA